MKRLFIKLVTIIAYFIGVDALFYRLNRNAKRIITFHNVLPAEMFKADLTNDVSMSDFQFRLVVGEIAKRFIFSTDLGDANSATLTFDDGYLNQYEVAGRILKEMGAIPAILFCAGDMIGNYDPFKALAVDKLLHWLAFAPNGEYSLFGHKFTLDDGNRNDVWDDQIWPSYAADVAAKGESVLRELNAQHPFSSILATLPQDYKRLRLTGMSAKDMNHLRSRGWKIGWHTHSHFPLASLGHDEKVREITPPNEFGNSPFSYPYGGREVDEESVAIAKTFDYPCAVSNVCCDVASPAHGRFFLPRLALPADKYRLHFILSGAEHFIRHWRLLPVISL